MLEPCRLLGIGAKTVGAEVNSIIIAAYLGVQTIADFSYNSSSSQSYETSKSIEDIDEKVILEEKKDAVHLSELNNDSVIGVLWGDDSKGVLLNNHENFFILNNDSICVGFAVKKPSIKEYFEYIKEFKDVYLFSSVKECFKWMSE